MSTTYILEDLQPDSSYEVYVQARNFYGTGAPTTRIVFRTASKTVVDLAKTGTLKYSVYLCPFLQRVQNKFGSGIKNLVWFTTREIVTDFAIHQLLGPLISTILTYFKGS